jgi:hypothetical protein
MWRVRCLRPGYLQRTGGAAQQHKLLQGIAT